MKKMIGQVPMTQRVQSEGSPWGRHHEGILPFDTQVHLAGYVEPGTYTLFLHEMLASSVLIPLLKEKADAKYQHQLSQAGAAAHTVHKPRITHEHICVPLGWHMTVIPQRVHDALTATPRTFDLHRKFSSTVSMYATLFFSTKNTSSVYTFLFFEKFSSTVSMYRKKYIKCLCIFVF